MDQGKEQLAIQFAEWKAFGLKKNRLEKYRKEALEEKSKKSNGRGKPGTQTLAMSKYEKTTSQYVGAKQ